jgi:hypothetical protein
MLNTFYQIDESIQWVKQSSSDEDAAAYQKAVGRVAGAIVMDVLEPLYKKNPSLKPKNWDED